MAFGQGKEVGQGGGSFRRFVGVGSVKVLAVNPTMEEWNKITGGNITKEIEYTSTTQDGVKVARITLLVQPDPAKTTGNIDDVIPVTFWFRKLPVQGSQTGKYQIIDKYGRTAWATKEEIEAKAIPQYSTGPAKIDADYRRIVRGEEEFTDFLKAYLSIPPLTYRDKNGNVVTHPNPSECEARLDNIMKMFDGDFKEIKTILDYQKNNYVKMLFGVRTTDEGKEYQDVFMKIFLPGNSTKQIYFAKELKEQEAIGRYTNTYFGEKNPNGEVILTDLHEYVVQPTTFVETTTEVPTAAPSNTFSTEKEDLPF